MSVNATVIQPQTAFTEKAFIERWARESMTHIPVDVAPISAPVTNPAKRSWAKLITEQLEIMDRERWQDRSPYIRKVYADLNLSDTVGIPPLIVRPRPLPQWMRHLLPAKLAPAPPKEHRSASTRGVLAQIALHVLDGLPPAKSDSEAKSQLIAVLAGVERVARHKKNFLLRPLHESASLETLLLPGFKLALTALQTKHIVLFAPNGAVSVLDLPDLARMLDMIRHDVPAQCFMDRERPVKCKKSSFPLPKHRRLPGFDAEGTIRLLEEMFRGQHVKRAESHWNDRHMLVTTVPFDMPRHHREGRLKSVYEKAGADGDTVWQNLEKRQAKGLKNRLVVSA